MSRRPNSAECPVSGSSPRSRSTTRSTTHHPLLPRRRLHLLRPVHPPSAVRAARARLRRPGVLDGLPAGARRADRRFGAGRDERVHGSARGGRRPDPHRRRRRLGRRLSRGEGRRTRRASRHPATGGGDRLLAAAQPRPRQARPEVHGEGRLPAIKHSGRSVRAGSPARRRSRARGTPSTPIRRCSLRCSCAPPNTS